jgi:hypothetical protein
MANIEKIEQMLQKAEVQLDEAKAALAKFEKGDNELLQTLRIRLFNKEYEDEEERGLWIKEKEKLEEKEKRLEEDVRKRIAQVELLRERLSAPTGNDFVTRVLGT